MPVLDRDALSASPLADLHVIASEIGLDGFRRLRKAELIDAIVERQGGDGDGSADTGADEGEEKPRRRRSRGGRGRGGSKAEAEAEPAEEKKPEKKAERKPQKRAEEKPERAVEGELELLENGSGFIRLAPPEASDDDVYVSAAQVRRCELVAGDKVGGPVRAPRRSERYPSLVRVETINGKPADEVAAGTPYDELAAALPADRLEIGGGDETIEAIDRFAPIGKGSRVVIAGGPLAGKTEALRRIAAALRGRDGLEVSVVLAGVRPEEAAEWGEGDDAPAAALSFATSADAQAQAVERVIEEGRRIAARGGDAVVLIDTLEHLHPPAARKVLAAARNLVEGGSLTVIATAAKPFGGETTVVTLDAQRTAAGLHPALDVAHTASLRPERLVGEKGAKDIAKARATALQG